MKESIKLIKNKIREFDTWLSEFKDHPMYNENKSIRDVLKSELEILSNHSVLHNIIESPIKSGIKRSKPKRPKIGKNSSINSNRDSL